MAPRGDVTARVADGGRGSFVGGWCAHSRARETARAHSAVSPMQRRRAAGCVRQRCGSHWQNSAAAGNGHAGLPGVPERSSVLHGRGRRPLAPRRGKRRRPPSASRGAGVLAHGDVSSERRARTGTRGVRRSSNPLGGRCFSPIAARWRRRVCSRTGVRSARPPCHRLLSTKTTALLRKGPVTYRRFVVGGRGRRRLQRHWQNRRYASRFSFFTMIEWPGVGAGHDEEYSVWNTALPAVMKGASMPHSLYCAHCSLSAQSK